MWGTAMRNDFFRPAVIIGTLPVMLTNGTTADATQVMADLNKIVNDVNSNAAQGSLYATLAQLAASSGASLIGTIDSVPNAVGLTQSAYLNLSVKGLRKTFGANPTPGVDNYTAIMNALTSGKTIEVEPGVYEHSTGLLLSTKNIHVVGEMSPGDGSDSSGCVFKFTGNTGAAFTAGANPDVDGTFLPGITLENLRFEGPTSCTTLMYMWELTGATIRNVALYGNSQPGRFGLRTRGGVNCLYEQIRLDGDQGASGNLANYLAKGLSVELGFNNDTFTTMIFRQCYLRLCNFNAVVGPGFANFEDPIFEAGGTGLQVLGGNVGLHNPWFEANQTRDAYFDNASYVAATGKGLWNGYARGNFMLANTPKQLAFSGQKFISTYATPGLFDSSASINGSLIDFDAGNSFNSGIKFGGTNFVFDTVAKRILGMTRTIFRYIQAGIAANTTYTMPTDDAIAGNAYVMPQNGHVMQLSVWYTGNITAGSYDVTVYRNGVATTIAPFALTGLTTQPTNRNSVPFDFLINQGDTLGAVLVTSVGFLATGGTFVVEITVALGADGRIV